MSKKHRTAGILGLSSVLVFLSALIVFGSVNKEFSFMNDYVSKLGALGEPNALWWNLIGFLMVGLLLFGFGLVYGLILKDTLLAVLLSLFGLGFALTSIPMDMQASDAAVSKAHVVAICLGLASWLFGLSRMGFNVQLKKSIRTKANLTAILLVASIIGFMLGFWSMPMTHRLVFGIVFGWTTLTSLDLISRHSKEN